LGFGLYTRASIDGILDSMTNADAEREETSDIEAVRAANRAFFKAFESRDIAEMDAVWAHEGQVTCAHPTRPLAVGWPEIREIWKTILHNVGEIRFDIVDEQIEVHGDLAWLVCVELVGERLIFGESQTELLATNLFRRENGRWLLVHHHSSPLVTRRGQGRRQPEPAAR
jgi:ketosteroid isomerase-like protein